MPARHPQVNHHVLEERQGGYARSHHEQVQAAVVEGGRKVDLPGLDLTPVASPALQTRESHCEHDASRHGLCGKHAQHAPRGREPGLPPDHHEPAGVVDSRAQHVPDHVTGAKGDSNVDQFPAPDGPQAGRVPDEGALEQKRDEQRRPCSPHGPADGLVHGIVALLWIISMKTPKLCYVLLNGGFIIWRAALCLATAARTGMRHRCPKNHRNIQSTGYENLVHAPEPLIDVAARVRHHNHAAGVAREKVKIKLSQRGGKHQGRTEEDNNPVERVFKISPDPEAGALVHFTAVTRTRYAASGEDRHAGHGAAEQEDKHRQ
mmetsp:Transcript_110937/g.313823  ORF Transcript_110937/g.313823 Transcript_110937/m.313823 type:complete len:319 (-) Transcript_110937:441-1397(-)